MIEVAALTKIMKLMSAAGTPAGAAVVVTVAEAVVLWRKPRSCSVALVWIEFLWDMMERTGVWLDLQ